MKKQQVFVVVGVVLVGVIGLILTTQIAPKEYIYQGSIIEPPVEAFDFELAMAGGESFRLGDQRGKVVLMFFGYANCPDVCPTTLSEFKRVHEALGEDAGQVAFVFVTVDPERDPPEMVAQYARAFNPDFIGLSGAEEELAPIWEEYFVYRNRVESESASGYLMEHSARVMVIDKHGNLRMTFPFGMADEAMTEDVQHLLAEE